MSQPTCGAGGWLMRLGALARSLIVGVTVVSCAEFDGEGFSMAKEVANEVLAEFSGESGVQRVGDNAIRVGLRVPLGDAGDCAAFEDVGLVLPDGFVQTVESYLPPAKNCLVGGVFQQSAFYGRDICHLTFDDLSLVQTSEPPSATLSLYVACD
jgi:hypothetical protein